LLLRRKSALWLSWFGSTAGAFYHVMNRGDRREKIFALRDESAEGLAVILPSIVEAMWQMM